MAFSEGQRVRVEFEATFGELATGWPDAGPSTYAWVTQSEGWQSRVPLTAITPLDPEFWPPQIGDIWITDAGWEYVIREAGSSRSHQRSGSGYSVVSALDTNAPTLSGRWDELRAANPTLARRRGVDL